MNKELEKFDPATLMQGVKDRIKATFVSLIPDTQWEEMVEKEINAFFNEKTKIEISEKLEPTADYWRQKKYLVAESEQTPFRALVWSHCIDMTYEVLNEKITKEYFTGRWVGTQPEITEEMKKIVTETSALGAARFFEQLSFNMMSQLQQSINQMR